MVTERSFFVCLSPGLGRLLNCQPVEFPSWWPDKWDDPDTIRWPDGAFYKGSAVRALAARCGGVLDPRRLVQPDDWECLFDQMGWSPDCVWVQAACWIEGRVFAIVGTAG